VFSTFANIPSGDSTTLIFHITLPEAWRSDGAEARYALTYQGQNTIRPTSLTVNIQPPDGAAILSTTPGLERNDAGGATWDGLPGDHMSWQMAFQGSQEAAEGPRLGLVVAAGLLAVGAATSLLAWRRRTAVEVRGRHRPPADA
jgi:hypothetical protein